MEDEILTAISELKNLVYSKVENINQLVEEFSEKNPQIIAKLRHEDIIQALFSPPTEFNQNAEDNLIDLTPLSATKLISSKIEENGEKVENSSFIQESKVHISSPNTELIFIDEDNIFDPLATTELTNGHSIPNPEQSSLKSNYLLLDFDEFNMDNVGNVNINQNLNKSSADDFIPNLVETSNFDAKNDLADFGDLFIAPLEPKSPKSASSKSPLKEKNSPKPHQYFNVKENDLFKKDSLNNLEMEIENLNFLDNISCQTKKSNSSSSTYIFDYENNLDELAKSFSSEESFDVKKDLLILKKSMPILNYISVPKYGEYLDVQFAEVVNSRNFYIHVNSEKVKKFRDELNDFCKTTIQLAKDDIPLNYNFDEDKLFCAYLEENGYYYRCFVLRHAYLSNYWVLLVDYGIIRSISGKHIYNLPEKFNITEYPVMALSCFLSESWTKDCKSLETGFFEFMRKNQTETSILVRAKFERQFLNRFPVSIMIKLSSESHWKNLEDCNFDNKLDEYEQEELKKKRFKFADFLKNPSISYSKANIEAYIAYYKSLTMKNSHLKLNTYFPAICPYVNNINKFICVIESFDGSGDFDPDHFTTNLTLFYENYVLEIGNTLNSAVVFRFKDFFFRGFIVKCFGEEYQLLSIDFGFIVNLVVEDIFPMVNIISMRKYPMFVCLCSLDNVMPSSKAWSTLAYETFCTWVKSLQSFEIIPRLFLKYTNCMYSIELKHADQPENASDLLYKMKYGVPMVSNY